MDRERWTRMQQLFDAALDMEPAERAGYLARSEADSGLRDEVARLLESEDEAAALAERVKTDAARILAEAVRAGFAPPAAGAHGDTPDPRLSPDDEGLADEGRRIGPYRILRRLGSGGMGAVFLAERADGQFEQRVALKLIKRGMDTEEILRRFRSERQILARLEHPSVARLHDGGMTDDGRPWFAMEHVDGEPIDVWCSGRDSSRQERLRLFLAVCDAVRYAHRNLVVHRDLKPDNILVRADGSVALLDFGIAKLLEVDERGTRTRGGPTPLTPSHAAPEQLGGGPITTATDVFALGVLLHELLTGERPERRGPDRAVTLRGDLGAICARALEAEPERRYGSVEELADDVRRAMGGLPVRARAAGPAYRARRFIARHRVGAAATLGLLVLLTGLVGFHIDRLRVERDRARAESVKARQVTDLLLDLFRQSDPDASRGREVTARELLERGADQVRRDLGDRPVLLAEMSTVIGSVFRSLGLFDDARPELERALALRTESFGERSPETAETALELAWLLHDLGEYDRAEGLARRALDIETALGRDSAAAAARHAVGALLGRKGDYAGEEARFRENLAERRALFGDRHEEVAQTLNGLGGTLLAQGRHHEAVASYRAAIDVRLALYGQDHREVATGYSNLGAALRLMGEYAAAEEAMRLSLDIRTRVLGAEHPHTTTSLNSLGVLMLDQGRLDDAEPFLRQALRIRREVLGPDHPQTGVPLYALATLLRRRGELEEAEPLFRESLALHRATLEPGHANIAHALIGMGMILADRGRDAEAEPYLREALSIRETAIGADHWLTDTAREQLGVNQSRLGRIQAADVLLGDAYGGLLEAFGPDDNRTARARAHLVEHYRTSGRPELADSLRAAAPPGPVDG